jgi:hypothetical protein
MFSQAPERLALAWLPNARGSSEAGSAASMTDSGRSVTLRAP